MGVYGNLVLVFTILPTMVLSIPFAAICTSIFATTALNLIAEAIINAISTISVSLTTSYYQSLLCFVVLSAMHVQSRSCPECVVILILCCKWFANWSLLCELWSAYQVGPIKPSISYGPCFCRASGCWTRRLCKSSKASWGVIWEDVATPKCVKWFCLSTIAELLGNKGTTHRATPASNAAFISFFFILFLDFAFYRRLGSYLQQQQMFQSKVLNFHQTSLMWIKYLFVIMW